MCGLAEVMETSFNPSLTPIVGNGLIQGHCLCWNVADVNPPASEVQHLCQGSLVAVEGKMGLSYLDHLCGTVGARPTTAM
ncbi:MAG: hypothetical protein DDT28_00340 [Dehalococcoidia bacterium]|nr:hypothetical protein [Chloroflexota bacterium]